MKAYYVRHWSYKKMLNLILKSMQDNRHKAFHICCVYRFNTTMYKYWQERSFKNIIDTINMHKYFLQKWLWWNTQIRKNIINFYIAIQVLLDKQVIKNMSLFKLWKTVGCIKKDTNAT